MTLVCLKSPESGPFPSELVAHPIPLPPSSPAGVGTQSLLPLPNLGEQKGERGSGGGGLSLPFLPAGSRMLMLGKVASEDVATVASYWRQQKSPACQWTLFIRVH